MGKERFLKKLGLPWEVAETREAKSESVGGDGDSENGEKKPSSPVAEESAEHPAEQSLAKEPATEPSKKHIETEEEQVAPAQIEESEAEELAKPEPEAMEGATGYEGGAVGDLRESIAFLPLLSLLGNKTWVWIVVLACVAIAGYFFLRPCFRRDENTSPSKEPVKNSGGDPVSDFLDNY